MDLRKAFKLDNVSDLQRAVERRSGISKGVINFLIMRAIRHNAPRCLEHVLSLPGAAGAINAVSESGQSPLALAVNMRPGLIPVLVKHGAVCRDDNQLRMLTMHLFSDKAIKVTYDYIDILKLLMQTGASQSCGDRSNLHIFCCIFHDYVTNPLNGSPVASRTTKKGNNLYDCLDFIAANSTNEDLIMSMCSFIKRHVTHPEWHPLSLSYTRKSMIPMLHFLHRFVCAIQKYAVSNSAQIEQKSPFAHLVESLHDTHYINTKPFMNPHRNVHIAAVKEFLHIGRRLVGYRCFEAKASMTHICVLLSEDHGLYAPFLNVYLDHHNVSHATRVLKKLLAFIDRVLIGKIRKRLRPQLEDGNLKRYLEQKLECIMSLKHLARCGIIRHIPLDRYISELDQLPIPPALKLYLMS